MKVFGLFAAMEAHHLIQALAKGVYDPGVVTSVPYAALGVLMLDAVWREYRRGRSAAPAPQAATRFA